MYPNLQLVAVYWLWSTDQARLYDPANDTYAVAGVNSGSHMVAARQNHTATLLQDGRVLLAGGDIGGGDYPQGAEIYDPASDTFAYAGLMVCRLFLGLFEAGHWPCALKTTQRLLPPESRTLGNSVLQSGTAIGAIVTPLIMLRMLTDAPGSWRPAFQVIAAVGSVWAIVWVFSTRSADLAPVVAIDTSTGEIIDDGDTFASVVFSRKFLVLVVIVVAINACWHLFRVWMPKFLQSGRGFDEKSMLKFMFWYNTATDIGCLSAGLLTRHLHRTGFSVHRSRCLTFGLCATAVAAGGLIPWLPAGPGLVMVLLLVAFGSLGLFPCYYSFSQELSTRHLGKATGLLGTIAWVTSSPLHPLFGRWVDQTKSFDLGMALTCGLPILALFVLILFWPANEPAVQ